MLVRAHKVLIGACIVFCVIFALAQARDYSLEGGTAPVVRGILSLLVGVGLVVYLVRFSREQAADREG